MYVASQLVPVSPKINPGSGGGPVCIPYCVVKRTPAEWGATGSGTHLALALLAYAPETRKRVTARASDMHSGYGSIAVCILTFEYIDFDSLCVGEYKQKNVYGICSCNCVVTLNRCYHTAPLPVIGVLKTGLSTGDH